MGMTTLIINKCNRNFFLLLLEQKLSAKKNKSIVKTIRSTILKYGNNLKLNNDSIIEMMSKKKIVAYTNLVCCLNNFITDPFLLNFILILSYINNSVNHLQQLTQVSLQIDKHFFLCQTTNVGYLFLKLNYSSSQSDCSVLLFKGITY